MVQLELLNRLKREGSLKVKQPLSDDLLKRIRAAAEDSEIPLGSYEILRRQGLVDS